MVWQYVFLPEAQLEYEESIDWYLSRSLVVAEKFVAAVDETLERITAHPRRWRNEFSVFRELGVKGFPFSIVYMLSEADFTIIVTAVHHHSRRPDTKYPSA